MPETVPSSLADAPESEEAFLQTLLNRISPTPNAALVLKVALRYASAHPKTLSPELLLTALRSRGEQKAPDWVKGLGQTLGAPEAMTLTGLSKSGLHKAKDQDRIFALRLSGENFDRFPLFQFAAGHVREWIPMLLSKVGNGLPAAHFLAIPRKRLRNRSYIDLVREADDAAVIAALLAHADSIGDEARSAIDPG
jgi:hypothetical protein